jgi:hypothetical protein
MKISTLLAVAGLALMPSLATAQEQITVGTLDCDVSAGLGLFIMQKQELTCSFTHKSGAVERYTGSIDQFGIELGEVKEGHLIWGVVSTTGDPAEGALAGTYAGVGANASFGAGAGANILVGGSNETLSLQPISVQGQTGINVAGGVTKVSLAWAP